MTNVAMFDIEEYRLYRYLQAHSAPVSGAEIYVDLGMPLPCRVDKRAQAIRALVRSMREKLSGETIVGTSKGYILTSDRALIRENVADLRGRAGAMNHAADLMEASIAPKTQIELEV